jgi:hypothetical protein
MASQPVPQHQIELGSPYCADPNCECCKKLRDMHEQIKGGSNRLREENRARVGSGH